jgi:hypothetical protein
MTHSGGKPHTNVGDIGQRYEVRAVGYPKAEESVIGWASTLDAADDMAAVIRQAPGCTNATILDREEGRRIESSHAAPDHEWGRIGRFEICRVCCRLRARIEGQPCRGASPLRPLETTRPATQPHQEERQ